MATVKQGVLTASGKWRRHLRDLKRGFWKSERQAQAKDAQNRSAQDRQVRKGEPRS